MVNLRECEKQDFKSVLPLLEQLWPDEDLNARLLEDVFSLALDSQDCVFLCAESGADIVGFCALSIGIDLWAYGKYCSVDELVIDSRHRRKRIGSLFIEKAVELARARGCTLVRLESAYHRTEAHDFYTENGFTKYAHVFYKKLEAERGRG